MDVLKENRGIALDELVSKAGIGKDEVMWALENLKEKKETVTVLDQEPVSKSPDIAVALGVEPPEPPIA